MHILSSMMGFALPSLIPRSYTHMASTVKGYQANILYNKLFGSIKMQLLFVYFGCKLLKDSCDMTSSGPSDELQEVEEELEKKKAEGEEADDEPAPNDVEAGKELIKKKSGKSLAKSFGAENLKIFTQV